MILGCISLEIERSSLGEYDLLSMINSNYQNVYLEKVQSFNDERLQNKFNNTINNNISNNSKTHNKSIFTPLIQMLLMGKLFTNINKLQKQNHISSSKLLTGASNTSYKDNRVGDELFDSLVNFLRSNIASDVINNSNINTTCKNNLIDAYVNNSTGFYYIKYIIDSTKNKNDVGSFQDCIYNNYADGTEEMMDKLQYVVVTINPEEHSDKKPHSKYSDEPTPIADYSNNGFFVIGMCMVKGCSEDEIIQVLINGNQQIGVLGNFEKNEVKVFCIEKNSFDFYTEDLINLIPLFLILIQVLFTLFPSVPAKIITWCIFKCKCFSCDNNSQKNNILLEKRKINENINNNELKIDDCNNNDEILTTNIQSEKTEKNNHQDQDHGDLVNMNTRNNYFERKKNNNSNDSPKNAANVVGEKYKNNILKVEKLFTLLRNIQDLFLINFTKENIKPTYDFSSIGYVIGIRGIAMFSIIIGYVYLILFESPLKIYCKDSYFNLIKSTLYNIIATGIRMSPRILFTCSGYCLAFKILIYFDKKMKFINEGGYEDRFFDEQNFIYCEDNLNNNERRLTNNSAQNQEKILSRQQQKLPLKFLFIFLIKQFHKYLLYVLALISFKLCLFTLFSYLGQVGPMWVFFKKYGIDNFTYKTLLHHILLIDSILADFDTQKNFVILFWIISLEIKFFILTSVFFYIAYRRNNRLDILIITFIPLAMILKVAFYFFMYYCSNIEFLPTLYYKSNYYSEVSVTALFNYDYYIIGVIFGTMNYIHQKSLTLEEIKSTGKRFLIIPLKIYNLFLKFRNSRKKSPKFLMFLLVLFGIFLAFSQKIFILFIELNELTDFNENYFKNHFLNCFYLVDVEIFIIILFLFCLGISMSENNFFFNILRSNYWIFKNKIYFGFILMMNPLICFIFYQSESRIKIEFFNVLFLSIVCYMNLFIYSSIYFILFDAPFKKLNRYILKSK